MPFEMRRLQNHITRDQSEASKRDKVAISRQFLKSVQSSAVTSHHAVAIPLR